MGGLNILGAFQVSYRSTHLEDPVVRPGAHAELGDGRVQEALPFPAHLTRTRSDLGVDVCAIVRRELNRDQELTNRPEGIRDLLTEHYGQKAPCLLKLN